MLARQLGGRICRISDGDVGTSELSAEKRPPYPLVGTQTQSLIFEPEISTEKVPGCVRAPMSPLFLLPLNDSIDEVLPTDAQHDALSLPGSVSSIFNALENARACE